MFSDHERNQQEIPQIHEIYQDFEQSHQTTPSNELQNSIRQIPPRSITSNHKQPKFKDQKHSQQYLCDQLNQEETQRIKETINSQAHKTSPNLLNQYLQHLWHYSFINNLDQCYSKAKLLQANPSFIQTLQSKILQNQSFQKCPTFSTILLIHSIQSTKYSEIVTIQIQIGSYKTHATILNYSSAQNQQSPLHSCANLMKFGAFGNIYLIKNQNETLAIKCIQISKQLSQQKKTSQKQSFFIKSLKQWFFLKLFSKLQYGPQIKKFLGFDIIFSSTCIEFAMEVCTPIKRSSQNQKLIKQTLRSIHALKIVHCDIKPGNMMWSHKFKKPVFIDFGGTKFIQQQIGYRTYTSFVGTTGFISNEMIKLLNEKNNFVDLYYNDFYGLTKSFALMGSKTYAQTVKCQKIDFFHNPEFVLVMIKKFLYTDDFQKIYLWLNHLRQICWNDLQDFEEKLAEFLIELRPNKQLRKLCLWLNGQIWTKDKLRKLKDTYKDNLSMILSTWNHYEFKAYKFSHEVSLYKKIFASYGGLSQIEQQIQIILFSKEKTLNFINFVHNQNNNIFDQDLLMIYSLVSLICCTLAHDPLNFTIQEKIKIADFFVKKVTKEAKDTKFPQLIFKCPLGDLCEIAYLLQYFLINVWSLIPERFRDLALKCLLSSLTLVGYPFYVNEAKNLVFYFLLQNYSSKKRLHVRDIAQRIKGILIYWKSLALINVHNKLFCSKQDSNFLANRYQILQILRMGHQIEEQLMNPIDQQMKYEEKIFIEANHRIFTLFIQMESGQISHLIDQYLAEFLEIVPQSTVHQRAFNEWRMSVQLAWNDRKIQKQRQFLMLFSDSDTEQDSKSLKLRTKHQIDYCLHFSLFINYCYKTGNISHTKKMLSIIDQIIIVPIVSERMFLNLRLYFSWCDHDVSKVKRLVKLILDESTDYSIYNFQFMQLCLDGIHNILKLEKFEFWLKPIPKLIMLYQLQALINKTQFFIQIILQQDQQSTQKTDISQFNPTQITLTRKKNKIRQYSLVRSCIVILNYILRLLYLYEIEGKFHKKVLRVFQQSLGSPSSQNLVDYLKSRLPRKMQHTMVLSQQTSNKWQDFIIYVIGQLQKIQSNSKISFYQKNQQQMMNNKILKMKLNENNYFENVLALYETQSVSSPHSQQKFSMLPVGTAIHVISSYYFARITLNKGDDLKDFEGVIYFYWSCKTQEDAYKYLYHFDGILLLFDAYVVCEKSYEELFTFFMHATSLLTKFPQKKAIDLLQDALSDKFCLEPNKQFKRKPVNWNPIQFITYVYHQRKRIKPCQNPYMAIVMHAMLRNMSVSYQIRKSLFKLIVRSMQFMKMVISNNICLLYLQAFILLPNAKLYLQTSRPKIHGSSKIKLESTKDMVRKQCYYASKSMRSRFDGANIDLLVEQRFKIIRMKKTNWELPKYVEKLYRKKFYRYHQIERDFIATNYEFEPYLKLIDNL